MLLSARSQDRDNNFNLIRFMAAFAVLASHSFVLALGDPGAQPGRLSIGMSPGDIGVDVFFVVSGFLVTGSLLRRSGLVSFLWARILRIYPALIAMIAICALVLSPLLGQESFPASLASRGTLRFLAKNLSLVGGTQLGLPGLFGHLPWRSVANGSLWTMTYEVRCYLYLAGTWTVLRLFSEQRRRIIFEWICAAVVLLALSLHLRHVLLSQSDPYLRLHLMFALGVMVRLLERRIHIDGRILAACVLAVGVCSLNRMAWQCVYPFLVPTILMQVAYAPSGVLLGFNRLGDASYGIYIFSFPIQQSVVQLVPGIGPGALTIIASSMVLPLSFVSWHLLESKVLEYRQSAVDATFRVMGGLNERVRRAIRRRN